MRFAEIRTYVAVVIGTALVRDRRGREWDGECA